jgi:hypothetical protein
VADAGRFDFRLDFLSGVYRHFPMSKTAKAGDATKSSLPFEDALKNWKVSFFKMASMPLWFGRESRG